MCMYGCGCACTMACVWKSEYNLGELVLSLYYVGLHGLTQVVQLGDCYLASLIIYIFIYTIHNYVGIYSSAVFLFLRSVSWWHSWHTQAAFSSHLFYQLTNG